MKKMFFVIRNNGSKSFIVPFYSQSKILDKLFTGDKLADANISQYNTYTKSFIKDNSTNSCVYWSDDFTWDSSKKAFNFNKLVECLDDDYTALANADPIEFDFANMNIGVVSNEPKFTKNSLLSDIIKNTPCPTLDECSFYINTMNWNLIVRNIKRNRNTMLVGPTSTGKTQIVRKICELLGINLSIYDMGSMQDPLTDLLGSHRLENGSSVFDYAKFTRDIQKPGVILLDELSRAPQQAANILFPCLDKRRQLPIEIADSNSDRVIKVHPECVFIATANIGDEYSGTEQIDAALMNRFMTIKLDYLPEKEEINLLKKLTGIKSEVAKKITNFARQIRVKYSEGELSMPISTRETICCAELVADGFNTVDAFNFAFIQKYIDKEEEHMVKSIMMGY